MYSRRQFLQLAGIALVGSQFNILGKLIPSSSTYQGRALMPATVRVSASLDAPIVHTLWPDSIVPIYGVQQEWYQTNGGFTPRTAIQPMTRYQPQTNTPMPETIFWAEVTGPVASVRQYCAADAPLVTRIGHGGAAQIIDVMPDTKGRAAWYGVADDGGKLLGWTQAVYWQPIEMEPTPGKTNSLYVNAREQYLMAYQDGKAVLQAPCSTQPDLKSGVYSVQERQIGSTKQMTALGDTFHGVPWRTTFDQDHAVVGVYWHNNFGVANPGPAIQVTPLLARWLYGWLNTGSRVEIE